MFRKYTLLIAAFVCLPFISVCQQKLGPERFEGSIQKFEQMDQETPFPEGAVLFVGSSSIGIWSSIDDDFPDVSIVNRGFGGSTFEDLLFYIDRVVTCYQPSKIFIYEGDNDISGGKKPKDILQEAEKVRQAIASKLPGVPVFFIAAKPSVARWKLRKKYQQLNSKLSLYAAKTMQTGFVNVWEPALDQNGEVFKDIFKDDNLHMNEKGYAIWIKALQPFL